MGAKSKTNFGVIFNVRGQREASQCRHSRLRRRRGQFKVVRRTQPVHFNARAKCVSVVKRGQVKSTDRSWSDNESEMHVMLPCVKCCCVPSPLS
eukprot:5051972-Amphidinium_carterae.1